MVTVNEIETALETIGAACAEDSLGRALIEIMVESALSGRREFRGVFARFDKYLKAKAAQPKPRQTLRWQPVTETVGLLVAAPATEITLPLYHWPSLAAAHLRLIGRKPKGGSYNTARYLRACEYYGGAAKVQELFEKWAEETGLETLRQMDNPLHAFWSAALRRQPNRKTNPAKKSEKEPVSAA